MSYWININTDNYLDPNYNRKNFMIKQFESLSLPNTRVIAYIPSTLPTIIGKNNINLLTEYACLFSHIKAIELGIEAKLDYFIIMEDDVVISYDIDYKELIKTAPEDWDILQLFVSNYPIINSLYSLYLNGINWEKWNIGHHCTGIYIINKKGAIKIKEKLKKEDNIDLSQYTKHHADYLIYSIVNTYSSTYPLFYSNIKLESNINKSHFKKHELSMNRIVEIQRIHKDKKPKYIL